MCGAVEVLGVVGDGFAEGGGACFGDVEEHAVADVFGVDILLGVAFGDALEGAGEGFGDIEDVGFDVAAYEFLRGAIIEDFAVVDEGDVIAEALGFIHVVRG